MKIDYRKVDSLTPYERNPRIHSDTQIKRIAESIKQFGWTQPIVIDGDGVILAGHGRHAAAKLLNMVQVPCVLADDLTPAQRKAYRVIDNKLTTDSMWDDENLQAELNDLVDLDFKIDDFGLDDFLYKSDGPEELNQDEIENDPNIAVFRLTCDLIDADQVAEKLNDLNFHNLKIERK